ncbi:MAG: patatin-like protein [Gammaproteobacteria bacterium]|nr:patatin-like protein [Gammaproteobacteria bacterium]
MAKKELRLAIVIYGGASLAVYMHGVTKELLKLVRASKVLGEMGIEPAGDTTFTEGPDVRESDTEEVYFELLKQINRKGEFRVVIDVIAGASAGAINGVMLGKAVVNDTLLDAQTSVWLNKADVEYLERENVSRWQKWYLYPFLRILSFWLPRDIGQNTETRGKLARLARSSWFRPPFQGSRLCHHLLDALEEMIATRRPGSSLLPPGQRLDVYSSITDLIGYPRTIRLHEELVARELEHGTFCRLTHEETDVGRAVSDFTDGNNPGLVWAARASSAIAGAYAPFHHGEMKEVLRARNKDWPCERRFLKENLFCSDGTPAHKRFDPAKRYFVDGGIVNNKPFAIAMNALSQRAADRQVERYILYIEPDPCIEGSVHSEYDLGYLSAIRASYSTIPRNQPILDDLNEIVAQDSRVRANRRVVDANRVYIRGLVDQLRAEYDGEPFDFQVLAGLRGRMVDRAAEEMGPAYRAYVQRRVWRLTDALVKEWALLAEHPNQEETHIAMTQSVQQWWHVEDLADEWSQHNLQDGFLDRFDVTFRIRRLQFLIRRLNQHKDISSIDAHSAGALAKFKRIAYRFLDRVYQLRHAKVIDDDLIVRLAEAAGRIPLEKDDGVLLFSDLSDSLGLCAFDSEFDEAFHEFYTQLEYQPLKGTLIADYVGFPVYDVLMMTPGSEEGGPDPLTPIRVERVSPDDCDTLDEAFSGLKCREFMGFLGFFNRGYREHDYLWGRLNGADRLVDILLRAAGDVVDDPEQMRRKLFKLILARERSRLHRCDEKLQEIGDLVAKLDAEG